MYRQTVTLRNVSNVHQMILTAHKLYKAAQILRGNKGALIVKLPAEKIYVPTLSMMYLGLYLEQLSRDFDVQYTITGTDYPWVKHLKNQNFFALKAGNPIEARAVKLPNEKQIPIQIDLVPDVSIDDNTVHEREVLRMQEIADTLAFRLIGQKIGNNFNYLAYSCREIMRNVIEHSYSDRLFYSATYFQKLNSVSVIVADVGDGVRTSLNEMPDFHVQTDKDALNYAVLPGFSGRKHKYAHPSNRHHQYQNSGFGLYMTRRICEDHGNFFIMSGDAGLSRKKEKSLKYQPPYFHGTIIRLVIRLDELTPLRDAIDRYRETALKMQKAAATYGGVSPSAASLLVRLGRSRSESPK